MEPLTAGQVVRVPAPGGGEGVVQLVRCAFGGIWVGDDGHLWPAEACAPATRADWAAKRTEVAARLAPRDAALAAMAPEEDTNA